MTLNRFASSLLLGVAILGFVVGAAAIASYLVLGVEGNLETGASTLVLAALMFAMRVAFFKSRAGGDGTRSRE